MDGERAGRGGKTGSERETRWTRGAAGRLRRLRVRAPWWPVLRLKVSFSGEAGWPDRRQPGARRPPPSWTVMLSPRGQARLAHSPTLLSPRALGSGPQTPSLPARGRRLGRQDVQYYTFLEVGRF